MASIGLVFPLDYNHLNLPLQLSVNTVTLMNYFCVCVNVKLVVSNYLMFVAIWLNRQLAESLASGRQQG